MTHDNTPKSAIDHERMCLAIQHRDDARALGISDEALWRKKAALKIAWDQGGGFAGARARLKFAQDFLSRQKAGE